MNSELVGSMCHTERKMFNSVQNGEIPSEMSYLVFISFPCQNRRKAECSLPESQESCLEITVLARIAESRNHRMFGNKNSFSCQSNLPFCVHTLPWPATGIPRNKESLNLANSSMKDIRIYYGLITKVEIILKK